VFEPHAAAVSVLERRASSAQKMSRIDIFDARSAPEGQAPGWR